MQAYVLYTNRKESHVVHQTTKPDIDSYLNSYFQNHHTFLKSGKQMKNNRRRIKGKEQRKESLGKIPE
jgi:hypothetical protein